MRPSRETFRKTGQTYFTTFQTARRQCFFRNDRWASLLVKTLERYSAQLHLHDFAVMPDHVHLIFSPDVPLERAVQLIKGGFSFFARRDLPWKGDIWQAGFTDHRIRDTEDFRLHIAYHGKNIQFSNAEGVGLRGTECALALAPLPPWLKPPAPQYLDGGAEAPPLQSSASFDCSPCPLSHSPRQDPPPEHERTDVFHARDAEDLFRKLGI